MPSSSIVRRRGFAFAAIAVPVLLVAFAVLRDRTSSADVEIRQTPPGSQDRASAPEVDLLDVERDVARASDAAPQAPASPVNEGGAGAHGLLVLPRGFPDPSSVEVYAWPVLDDGSGEFDDSGRGPVDRLAGTVEGLTWRFDALAPGRWVFVGRAVAGERSALGLSKEIEILPGTSIGPISVVLEEYAIEGRVIDGAGAPIEGIAVLHKWTPTDWRTASVAPARFRIGDRDEMRQELREALSTILFDAADVEPFMATVDDEMLALFADRLPGRPIDDAAAEEEWVRSLVDAWTVHMAPGYREPDSADAVFTDARGSFRLRFDGPGVVELWVAPAYQPESLDGRRWITAEIVEELVVSGSLVTRDVVLARTGGIDGTVTLPDGEAAMESYVFVLPFGGGVTKVPRVSGEGRFVVSDLKPGKYLVGANEEVTGEGWLTWCRIVEVEEAARIEVEGALAPAATVRGVIVGRDDLPLEGVELRARGLDVEHLVRTAKTDALGRFELPKLYPWRFTLEGVERELVGSTDVDLRDGARDVDVGTLVAQ